MMHEAIKIARHYQKLFGDDFYMEVQYHGIPAESFVYPREVKVARELGIKLIAANDSHIPTKEYMEVRTMLENIRYIKNAKSIRRNRLAIRSCTLSLEERLQKHCFRSLNLMKCWKHWKIQRRLLIRSILYGLIKSITQVLKMQRDYSAAIVKRRQETLSGMLYSRNA